MWVNVEFFSTIFLSNVCDIKGFSFFLLSFLPTSAGFKHLLDEAFCCIFVNFANMGYRQAIVC